MEAGRFSCWSRAVGAALVAALGLAFAGCHDGAVGGGGDAGADGGVDGLSGATPLVASALLGDGHSGWARADCATCHADPHGGAGYRPADCTTCHGPNGSPALPAGHAVEACGGCHGGTHAGLGFAAPGDCRSCHALTAPAAGACASTEEFDVAVIGAGGGGLAAAAYLARNGLRVVVLEKHYKPGGYMVSFTRGDYRFEASLHAFDGLDPDPYSAEDPNPKGSNVVTFEQLGILDKVAPVKCDPMYVAFFPLAEHRFLVPADPDAYRALLAEKFPAEAEGIDALFAEMAAIDEVMRIIFRYQNEGKDIAGEDLEEFLAEIQAKELTEQLLLVQEYMGGTTLAEFLAQFVTDPQLIGIWTQLAGFAGGSPDEVSALFFIAMWNSYHYGGFYYFAGGAQAVSDALVEVIEENDGELRYNALVTKIDVADGLATAVRTADGGCVEARYVISNANARATLLDMVGAEQLPTDPESPFHPAKLAPGNPESLVVGMSIFQVYLGVAHDYTALFEGSHEVMISESYDQAENFASYTASDYEHASYAILDYSVVDPDDAPAGKNVVVLTTILQFDFEEQWHFAESREAYEQLKREVALRLVGRAEADFLPGLAQYVEVMEIGTPQTMRGFTLSPAGSIFGWDPRPEQSLSNRLPQQTPIDNLLLAGAWTFPGGGQSAVLTSGMLAGMAVLEKEAAAAE